MKKVFLLSVFCMISLLGMHAQKFALIDMEYILYKPAPENTWDPVL